LDYKLKNGKEAIVTLKPKAADNGSLSAFCANENPEVKKRPYLWIKYK